MPSTILLIFEGENTEKQIINNLTKYYVNENTNVQCAFCSDIYQLYNKLCADPDLDTFGILKKRPQNQNILSGHKRSDFAEIYLFFDYDGHATNADDEVVKDLLRFFNEETEFGKIYISYPMVESIKHISSSINFENLKVQAKININYKNQVHIEGSSQLRNLSVLTESNWRRIIEEHLKKMNSIVYDSFDLPTNLIPQIEIFNKQLEKYIDVDSTVAVLSAIPIFVLEYYGVEKTNELLT